MKLRIFKRNNEWFAVDVADPWKDLLIDNPDILATFPKEHINGYIIPKSVEENQYFDWPGSGEMVDDGSLAISLDPSHLAKKILKKIVSYDTRTRERSANFFSVLLSLI